MGKKYKVVRLIGIRDGEHIGCLTVKGLYDVLGGSIPGGKRSNEEIGRFVMDLFNRCKVDSIEMHTEIDEF